MKYTIKSLGFLLLFSSVAFGQEKVTTLPSTLIKNSTAEQVPERTIEPNTAFKALLSEVTYDFNDGNFFDNYGAFTSGTKFGRTTSSNSWYLEESSETFEGTFSLRSGEITHNQNSNIYFLVNIAPGGGTLSFSYRLSTESCCDYLVIEADGSEIVSLSGETSWNNSIAYDLPEGEYYIDFWYTKDGSADGTLDAVFLDNVTVTGLVEETVSVTNITPNAAAPGETVTIFGAGFSTTASENEVHFNGVTGSVLEASENKLKVQVPSVSAGFKSIEVSNGTNFTEYVNSFSVLNTINLSFGSQNVISSSGDAPFDVFPADIDGDDDLDVLVASGIDNTISYYRNNGDGTFGSENQITTSANDARKVRAADFDGDGDLDVVYVTATNQLVWYENDGGGNFFSENILSSGFYSGLNGLHTADIDGDGDVDIVISSLFDNRIDWYENDGTGTFSSASNISLSATQPQNIYSADLDNDGDLDVISAASGVEIAWYPNNGDGTFASGVNIGGGDVASDVFAADLDNDGDMDVLSSSVNDDRIAWYENFGSGSFSNQIIISNSANGAASIYAADLDGDGDQDVLSASTFDDKIAWYENFGDNTFGSQQILTGFADGANSVRTADLDGDGDLDVLSTSEFNDQVSWFENTGVPLAKPSLPVTFDDSGVDYDLVDFAGNQSQIVTDPEDGSNLVAQTTKLSDAQNIAGTTIGLSGFDDVIPFSEGNTVMSVRIWSPEAGIPIRLKVEDSNDNNISVETEELTSVSSGWETIHFDFSDHVSETPAINFSNNYSKVVIFFNFGTSGADAGEQTYYWDDVQFTSGLPITSLPDVRNSELGTILKTKGVVTRVLGNNISIQDGNTGLHVFAPSATAIDTAIINGNIAVGDSLVISGELAEFFGLLEIDNIADFNVTSRGNTLPEPQEITLSELGEEYESELVKITNISTPNSGTFTNNTPYDLVQNGLTYSSTLWIGGSAQTELGGVNIPDLFNYVGVLRQATNSSGSTNNGYQLVPTLEEDIAAGLNFAVTKVFPEAAAPGTNITIYGKGFDSNPTANTVSIGGFTADIVEASATKLVVTVPAASAGLAEISVTANSFSETYAGNFTSLQPISANFAAQSVISTLGDAAYSVFATDLDGDGDLDVISASYTDDKIAWYQNNGDGTFGAQTVISTLANGPSSVYAADLDGDGDQDVLSASSFDDKIAWYENNGDGTFASQAVISTLADGAESVYATDLDNDGDIDVLSASKSDDRIAWYENNGDGTFGAQTTISTLTSSGRSVYAADLDGDGDQDVLSASFFDDKIAWYQNNGDGTFGAQTIISTLANGAQSVFATDLDGDGDLDVLSASSLDDKIAWYQNNGDGTFGAQTIISTLADGANTVYAADIDGDGDQDVLSASLSDNKIAWYQNNGDGSFSTQANITTIAAGAESVYAADLDSDGDLDVLSASRLDDKIAWYENTGTLNVPLSSIADARVATKGTYIRVRGIVTRQTDNKVMLQENFSGLHIYRAADFNSLLFGENIQEGDSIEVLGQVSAFGGLQEIVNIQEFIPLSTGNPLPEPITITLDEVSETYESVLVRVNDLSTDSTGSVFREHTFYDLYENDVLNQTVPLFATGAPFTNILGVEIPESFAFEGIVVGVDLDTYRLEPINQTDIIDLSLSPPSNVVASEAASSINLSWDASTSVNASGYNVYRATEPFTDSTSATKINPSLLTGTSFVDSNVQSNTRYYYRIATYSANLGIQSDLSNEATSGFDIISVYAMNKTAANSNAGSSVTIYGTNLPTTAGSVEVTFGETVASITTQLANQLVVSIPDINPGNYQVEVTVNSAETFTLADLFTVLEDVEGESGFFQSPSPILAGGILGATTVRGIDLDADLDNDILASLYNQEASENIILLDNPGDASFTGIESLGDEGDIRARDVTYGDFNGDGFLDIAAVYDRSITWYVNNQDGTFSTNSNATVQTFPVRNNDDYALQSLLAFDSDQDGDIDLVHSSQITDDIFLYVNDGAGNFTTQVTIDSNAPLVSDLAVADINEDGRLEIIATLQASDQLVYYPNNGSTFGGRTLISSALDVPKTVVTCNIDGDSDIDLLSISQNDSKVAWYGNNAGSGSFSTQKIISEDLTNPFTAAVADLDGDGLLEVIVGTLNGDVVLYRNEGSENFSAGELLVSNAGEIRALAVSDLDGDGDLDILASDFTNNTLLKITNVDTPPSAPTGLTASRDIGSIALSWDANAESDLTGYEVYRSLDPVNDYSSISGGVQTETTFTDTDVTNAITYYYRIASVDDNGSQTRSDSVAIKAIATQIAQIEPMAGIEGTIIRISGVGFSQESSNNAVSIGGTSANIISQDSTLLVAEIPNGLSGNVGISVTTLGTSVNYPAPFKILSANDGTFGSPETEGNVTGIANIATSDLDGDDLSDLIVPKPNSNQIGLYFSNGDDPFSNLVNLNFGSNTEPTTVRATNIYGTDYPDFVFISTTNNQFVVLKNNGSNDRSSFLDQAAVTVSHITPTDIFTADMNNDGYQDVIISSSGDGKISWYENQSFNESVAFGTENNVVSSAGNIRSIYAGDFNGDDLTDIVAAIGGANQIVAYYNNGDGTFSESVVRSGISVPEKVMGTDLDNDGDLDLLYVSSNDDIVEAAINTDGSGSFSTVLIGSGISGASDVSVGDLNGDGLTDIITSSPNSGEAFWFQNNGSGNFSSSNLLLDGLSSIDRVIATDIDGNGKLDVAYRSFSDTQIGVIKNFTITPLQITGLDAGSNSIIRVNQPISILFNSSNSINSITNFTDFFSGAIDITTRTGESLPIGDLSVSGNELLIENINFYALDTLSVEVSSQVVSDNSGGLYFIDTDGDEQQTGSDVAYTSDDFYTTMIGDFTGDLEVGLSDLVSFGNGWRSDNFSFETAPLDFSSSSFPYARLIPDNDFNVDDIIAFIRYWNLTQERNSAAKANSFAALRSSYNGNNSTARSQTRQTNDRDELDGEMDINKPAVGPSSASKEASGEIFADSLSFISYQKVEKEAEYVTNPSQAKREVTYDFTLSHPDSVEGLSLIIDYDEDKLVLANVEDRGLFDIHSENANVFLSHVDTTNGILTLNVANFGKLTSITERAIVSVTFNALSDQDSELLISSDIRAKDLPALQQVAMKAVQVREDLPETFTLSQNYPNPFNPSTSIHYELAEQAKVSLTVYDILGRKIETLLNENSIRAGYYKVNWDASRYASGMYIYVLNVQSQSGKFYTATKKMMMVK
jgi:hypothetical protein